MTTLSEILAYTDYLLFLCDLYINRHTYTYNLIIIFMLELVQIGKISGDVIIVPINWSLSVWVNDLGVWDGPVSQVECALQHMSVLSCSSIRYVIGKLTIVYGVKDRQNPGDSSIVIQEFTVIYNFGLLPITALSSIQRNSNLKSKIIIHPTNLTPL